MAEGHIVIPRTMCFVFHDNKVLLIKGSSEKEWEGKYDPLGGHVEKGESIINSSNREIKEESGLDVHNTKLRGIVHVTNFFGKNVMMFVTSSNSNTKKVISGSEGELEWVNLEDLDTLNIFEDVKPILRHILEMKPDKLFIGTSEFDGKDKLLAFDIKIS